MKFNQQYIYKESISFNLCIGFRFLYNFLNDKEKKYAEGWYRANKTVKPYGKERQVLINKNWHEVLNRFFNNYIPLIFYNSPEFVEGYTI